MKKSVMFICILFPLVGFLYSQVTPSATGPLIKAVPDTLAPVDLRANYLQFSDRRNVERLRDLLSQAEIRPISFAHFGDSHVQLDHFPSTVRVLLQSKYGNAGRGVFFPFSICKTYSHVDYTSRFSGRWLSANSIQTPPKIPLGVSGFVARPLDDRSSFKIYFKQKLTDSSSRLVLLMRSERGHKRVKVDINGRAEEIVVSDTGNSWPVSYRGAIDSITCTVENASEGIDPFFLDGLVLLKDGPGIRYDNLGVGGAIFSALLHQQHFDSQISVLAPDIVILDWGTNDIIYKNTVSDTLEATITRTIEKIRKHRPEAVVILTTVQDMNWKGKNVSAVNSFAALIRKIAIRESCLLYDWYVVAGGAHTMKVWEQKGWGRKDNIHLTPEGYKLKGRLFYDAIMNTLDLIGRDRDMKSFYIDHF